VKGEFVQWPNYVRSVVKGEFVQLPNYVRSAVKGEFVQWPNYVRYPSLIFAYITTKRLAKNESMNKFSIYVCIVDINSV
jgi:hypothetical protein